MKKIVVFLASSSLLSNDRKEFELFVGRKNKVLLKKNIYIELVVWEDFIDAMSRTRLQDGYNNAIKESDIFMVLIHSKVGKYTKEEFETAFGQFKATGKPLIYTYFKSTPANSDELDEDDIKSLRDFQARLGELGHFWTKYENVDALINHFNHQLNKLDINKIIKPTEEDGIIHIAEPLIQVPEWGTTAEVHFSITNNTDTTKKLTELNLIVNERKEIEDVRLMLAGAPVKEYKLEADIRKHDEVDLLKGLDIQFITAAGESEAIKLMVECSDGYRYRCTISGNYTDLHSGELLRLKPASFTIVYPISSLETLRARKTK